MNEISFHSSDSTAIANPLDSVRIEIGPNLIRKRENGSCLSQENIRGVITHPRLKFRGVKFMKYTQKQTGSDIWQSVGVSECKFVKGPSLGYSTTEADKIYVNCLESNKLMRHK